MILKEISISIRRIWNNEKIMSNSFFTDLSVFKRQTSNETVEDPKVIKLDHLPAEIHVKILSLLDLSDVLAYSSTCKVFYRYAENQQIW